MGEEKRPPSVRPLGSRLAEVIFPEGLPVLMRKTAAGTWRGPITTSS